MVEKEKYVEYLKRKGMKSSEKASKAWRKEQGLPPAKPYKPVKYDKRTKKGREENFGNLALARLRQRKAVRDKPKKAPAKKKVDGRGAKKIELLNPDRLITRSECNESGGGKKKLNKLENARNRKNMKKGKLIMVKK